MIKAPDLSIVIGTYKTKDLTVKTVESILKFSKGITVELIVVDDCSNDGTSEVLKEKFPEIIVLKNQKNLGYCKTYNKGTKKASGRYILHMNSDVLFLPTTKLASVINYMDKNPDVGILGNKVLRSDGKLDPPSRHAVPTLKNTIAQSLGLYKLFPRFKSLNYYMTYLNDGELVEVGGVGAFMLVRREVFDSIGLIDERFTLYCQDSDFCYRAYLDGWKLVYFPGSVVKHLGAGTARRFKVDTQTTFHKDMWRYYKKHYLAKKPLIVGNIVFLGLTTRFFIFIFVEGILFIKKKLSVTN